MFPFCGFSQLSGNIKTDQRAIITEIKYELIGSKTGVLTFDIAVDLEGKVTSCIYIPSESTFRNTPSIINAKNKILTGLRFEPGHQFPKHHQGKVRINCKTN